MPKYIAILALTTVATAVLELLVHGGGANTSRHTRHKKNHYRYKNA